MVDSINSRFQSGPNPGGSGNPGGVYNTAPAPQIRPGYYGQQTNQGRYRPPTMGGNGTDPGNWNDYGGYSYNVPNHYGVGSGWQSPQMSPFPQFAQRGSRGLDYYLQMGREAERNTRAGLADGSVVATQDVGRDGQPITRYTRPGQQRWWAWGGPEAYAAWQARRNAMAGGNRGGQAPDTMYAGGSSDFDESTGLRRSDYPTQEAYEAAWRAARNATPNFSGWIDAYQQGLAGEAPPTSGSPYRAPRETHVGGPESTYPTKGPPVSGGTKGPAPDIQEPLEDWMPRFNRFRDRRWGRY